MACDIESRGRITHRTDTYRPHQFEPSGSDNQETKIVTIMYESEHPEDPAHVVQYSVEGEQLIKIKPTNENS